MLKFQRWEASRKDGFDSLSLYVTLNYFFTIFHRIAMLCLRYTSRKFWICETRNSASVQCVILMWYMQLKKTFHVYLEWVSSTLSSPPYVFISRNYFFYQNALLTTQITTSLMEPPGLRNITLMLADTESEKTKWVVALSELHRILKRNNLPNTTVRYIELYYVLDTKFVWIADPTDEDSHNTGSQNSLQFLRFFYTISISSDFRYSELRSC